MVYNEEHPRNQSIRPNGYYDVLMDPTDLCRQ